MGWSSTAGHAAPLSRGPEETEAEGNGKLGLRRSLSCLHDDGVRAVMDVCLNMWRARTSTESAGYLLLFHLLPVDLTCWPAFAGGKGRGWRGGGVCP